MVQAALDLFRAHGVNGTSIDQVLARSKTGKGQFAPYPSRVDMRSRIPLGSITRVTCHRFLEADKSHDGSSAPAHLKSCRAPQ